MADDVRQYWKRRRQGVAVTTTPSPFSGICRMTALDRALLHATARIVLQDLMRTDPRRDELDRLLAEAINEQAAQSDEEWLRTMVEATRPLRDTQEAG